MSLLEKIPALQGLNADDLYNAFLGLDRRGQILVSSGVVLVLLILLFVPLSYVSSKLDEQQDAYTQALDKAGQIYGVLTEYSRLQKTFRRDDEAGSGGDVLQNLVYDMSEAAGIDIKKHRVVVKSQKPVSGDVYEEISKEVELSRLPLDQALRFLDKIKSSRDVPVKIKKLSMVVEPRERGVLRELKFVLATLVLK